MNYDAVLLARLDALQAELAALAALVRQDALQPSPRDAAAVHGTVLVVSAPRASMTVHGAPAPSSSPKAPAPAASPAASGAPRRRGRPPGVTHKWSTTAGASYRLIGDNPFKRGNNYTLFGHLASVYGGGVFTREELGRAVEALRADGAFDATMDDRASVVAFITLAGGKARLEMASEVPPTHARVGSVRGRKVSDAAPVRAEKPKREPKVKVSVAAPTPVEVPKREPKVKLRRAKHD